MSQDLLVAGVDVGGTNIEVGLVTADHQVHARAKTDTPTGGPVEVLDTIATLIHSLEQTPIAVGVGIPGVVDQGQVLTVPNLENWHETSISSKSWDHESICPLLWATMPTSVCWVSGWPARPSASATCWDCGWAPGSAGA